MGHFVQADSIVPLASQGTQAWDRYAYTSNNPVNYADPTGHWPEWVNWIMGAGCQYADDMSLGLFSMVSGDLDYNESQAFQDGRQAGRIASTVIATVNEVQGAALVGAAAAGVLPTAGGSLAAAPVTTGGTSLVVGGAVVAGEVVVGVAGATSAVYGGAVIAKIQGDPLGGDRSQREIQKSINSLEKRITQHEEKLRAYIKDPYAFDNQGLLRNAPNDEARQRIINGRINHLQREIDNWQREIENYRKLMER